MAGRRGRGARRWRWQHLRPILIFGAGLRGKARDFNWHHVIGFWSFVPLFVVVLTAIPISFPWANDLVYRAAGDAPPQLGPPPGEAAGGAGPGREGGAETRPRPSRDGLNVLWASAEHQVGEWTSINLRVSAAEEGPVTFAIDRGDGGQPQLRSTLTLDRTTGDVISHEAFGDQSAGRRWRTIARFAHTGEVLGLTGQTIAGVVTAGAVVLVWTGLALTWRRFTAWLRRLRDGRRAESERPAA